MNTQYDSRTADKFVVRLPDGLRADIERAAGECDTSMNTVFIRAVRQYLDGQQRQQLLLDALAKAVTGKEELDAVLHWRGKHTQAIRERDALQALLTTADERADNATLLIRRIVANFDTEIECHEDVEPNDLEHDQVLADMRDFLAGRAAATQHQGEPVAFTAVGVLRDDGDGGLAPEWILEGGTAELWAGAVLLIADEDQELCAEDGHCELYRNPPEQPAQEAVPIQGGANLRGQSFIRNCQVTCCGSCPGGCTVGNNP